MAFPTLGYQITTPILSAQPITDTSPTQRHPFGTIVRAVDPTYGEGEFIYGLGVASTAAGDAVTVNSKTGVTARAVHTTAAKGQIASAMAALTAALYGWYQIGGCAIVKAGTVVSGSIVYLTSTAGQVDDASVAGDGVNGAVFLSADGTPAAGFALVQFTRPNCTGNGA